MSFSSTLVCPISPNLPGEPPEQSWDDLRDADVLADDRLVEIFEAEDKGDVVEADDDDDAQMVRGIPPPLEPSLAEIARHNINHFPYRSWCRHCLSGRRPNSHHRSSGPKRARKTPLFCSGYGFVKDSQDEEMTTLFVGRLYLTHSTATPTIASSHLYVTVRVKMKNHQSPHFLYQGDWVAAPCVQVRPGVRALQDDGGSS